jgi:AraC-like DNA-binding protein
MPQAWPEEIGVFIQDAVVICQPAGALDLLYLIVIDIGETLRRLAGPRFEAGTFVASLIGKLVNCSPTEARAHAAIAVRNHLRLLAPEQHIAGTHARRLAAYIDLHLEERLTIRRLSRVSGWAGRELAKNFQRQFTISIHEYIVRARVRKAIGLLVQGDKAVTVMNDVGYHNKTSFNKAFKKVTGMTPRYFQRAVRNPSERHSVKARLRSKVPIVANAGGG